MLRKIIEIDEHKCDGCGLCIPACPEGAIRMTGGKARLVKDFYCDGLGACIGHCPQGAITITEREADAYDEQAVMKNVLEQGPAVIEQHLEHLRAHGEHELLKQAEAILARHGRSSQQLKMAEAGPAGGGCPGSQSMSFSPNENSGSRMPAGPSALTHWPVQMHLISPQAPHYRDSDVLLAADCVAFSMGNFHQTYLEGKTLAIACPKLDDRQEIYLAKLVALIDEAMITSLSVMIMQVPCCSGLVHLAQSAMKQARRRIPLRATVVGINGEILNQTELN